jgi:hypothetical protein
MQPAMRFADAVANSTGGARRGNRRLVDGLAARYVQAVREGDPVIAHGRFGDCA